jgi:hypothetical protein
MNMETCLLDQAEIDVSDVVIVTQLFSWQYDWVILHIPTLGLGIPIAKPMAFDGKTWQMWMYHPRIGPAVPVSTLQVLPDWKYNATARDPEEPREDRGAQARMLCNSSSSTTRPQP